MVTKKNIKRHTIKDMKNLKDKSDWEKVLNMKNEDIDTSDDPVMSDAFWEGAELIYPDKKTQRVSIRVKPKVVDWFKKNYKKGHQTQMHNVLESYVESKMAHCK